jgi:predicted amidohydrolase YtcJ
MISDKLKSLKQNDWLVLYNLNIETFSEKDVDVFDKSFIDKIAPNNNVVIIDSLRSFTLCNSKVIETLQIKKPASASQDDNVQVDEKGEFTGLFFDDAQKLIFDKIPEFSNQQIYNAVENGSIELLKYGITEVQDRTITKDAIDIFKQLIDSNKLNTKIYGVLTGDDVSFDELQQKGIIENYKDKLTVRAVCLDYDGAFELQDASMKSHYTDESKESQPYIDSAKIEEIFNKAIDKNFQFRIKVVGDKGVNVVVNTLSQIIKAKNLKDHRTVLECVEFVSPQDILRMKEFNIIPSIRPETTVDDIEIVPQIISSDYLKNIGLWKSLIQSTGKLISGSGFPFENQINPFIQIYFLTQRKQIESTNREVPNSEQKLSLTDALKSFTIWAAYSGFEENNKGNLVIGKVADMLVISDDIFNLQPEVLLKVKVDKTIINGRVMYDILKN